MRGRGLTWFLLARVLLLLATTLYYVLLLRRLLAFPLVRPSPPPLELEPLAWLSPFLASLHSSPSAYDPSYYYHSFGHRPTSPPTGNLTVKRAVVDMMCLTLTLVSLYHTIRGAVALCGYLLPPLWVYLPRLHLRVTAPKRLRRCSGRGGSRRHTRRDNPSGLRPVDPGHLLLLLSLLLALISGFARVHHQLHAHPASGGPYPVHGHGGDFRPLPPWLVTRWLPGLLRPPPPLSSPFGRSKPLRSSLRRHVAPLQLGLVTTLILADVSYGLRVWGCHRIHVLPPPSFGPGFTLASCADLLALFTPDEAAPCPSPTPPDFAIPTVLT
jgi:hypothetical protein